MNRDWFETWFNSPYYDLLYKHRDETEAEEFLDNLLEFLDVSSKARILDLACGKGRFSFALAERGYDVIGLDLSEENIEEARREAEGLISFHVHDMREVFRDDYFDYVFNFFTSFGYFEEEEDHLKTLRTVHQELKSNGIFVIDFFNAHKVKEELIPEEKKEIRGMTFEIEREKKNGFIYKHIHLKQGNKEMHFTERVRAFHLDDFREMLKNTGFTIREVFGSYQLDPYEESDSKRLIIIAKAKND